MSQQSERKTSWRITLGFGALALLLVGGLVGAAVTTGQFKSTFEGLLERGEHWQAPASAVQTQNPVPADAQSIESGKRIYELACATCHGPTGKGNGPAAASLNHAVPDLTSAKVRDQTDGALYWKISVGMGPMPPWGGKLSEEEIWSVINYVRTLAQ